MGVKLDVASFLRDGVNRSSFLKPPHRFENRDGSISMDFHFPQHTSAWNASARATYKILDHRLLREKPAGPKKIGRT